MLQKLVAFCFNDQHVDSLYTNFKSRLWVKIVVKNGQVFDIVQRAVQFKHLNRGLDRMPSIAKKRLLRKKNKKHLLSYFHETQSTQSTASGFGDKSEQVKKTKLEVELRNIADCFLDCHGNYTCNLVSLKVQSW